MCGDGWYGDPNVERQSTQVLHGVDSGVREARPRSQKCTAQTCGIDKERGRCREAQCGVGGGGGGGGGRGSRAVTHLAIKADGGTSSSPLRAEGGQWGPRKDGAGVLAAKCRAGGANWGCSWEWSRRWHRFVSGGPRDGDDGLVGRRLRRGGEGGVWMDNCKRGAADAPGSLCNWERREEYSKRVYSRCGGEGARGGECEMDVGIRFSSDLGANGGRDNGRSRHGGAGRLRARGSLRRGGERDVWRRPADKGVRSRIEEDEEGSRARGVVKCGEEREGFGLKREEAEAVCGEGGRGAARLGEGKSSPGRGATSTDRAERSRAGTTQCAEGGEVDRNSRILNNRYVSIRASDQGGCSCSRGGGVANEDRERSIRWLGSVGLMYRLHGHGHTQTRYAMLRQKEGWMDGWMDMR